MIGQIRLTCAVGQNEVTLNIFYSVMEITMQWYKIYETSRKGLDRKHIGLYRSCPEYQNIIPLSAVEGSCQNVVSKTHRERRKGKQSQLR